MHVFNREVTRDRLEAAAQAIEARTCIEVVIVVRARATSMLHADLVGGAVLAYALLLVLLFAPPEFSLEVMAVAVPAAFAIGALGVHAVPAAQRLLCRNRRLDAAVRAAAQATFVQRDLARTAERSALLLYVALAEARIVVVDDRGLRARVPAELWTQTVRAIEGVAHNEGLGPQGVAALVEAMSSLATTLQPYLPRAADDVDEIADEIV